MSKNIVISLVVTLFIFMMTIIADSSPGVQCAMALIAGWHWFLHLVIIPGKWHIRPGEKPAPKPVKKPREYYPNRPLKRDFEDYEAYEKALIVWNHEHQYKWRGDI